MNPCLPTLVLLFFFSGTLNGELCSEPEILNGWVEGTTAGDAYFGQVSCNAGFHLVGGSGKVKCRSGRWSPMEIPVCASIGSCPEIPRVANGRSVPIRGSRGSALRFKCRPGYKVYGTRTTYCQGHTWSHTSLPVCVNTACDVSGRMDIPYGEARSLMGGGVYKYRCNSGLEMDGPDTVYCTGDGWSASVPTCLVPPGSLQLQIPEILNAGDLVSVSCHATSGNPLPHITLSVGDEIQEDSAFSASIPLVVTPQHDGKEIVCKAQSRAGQSSTSRTIHVISAPLSASVTGPTTLHHGKMATYSCSVEGGRPIPTIRWRVRNDKGEEWDKEGDSQEPGLSNLSISPPMDNGWMDVECLAENPTGKTTSSLRAHIHFLPKSVSVSLTSSSSPLEFFCYALGAFPAPRILWRIEKTGVRTEVVEEEGEVRTENTGDGAINALSSLKVTTEEGVVGVRVECRAVGEGDLGERRSQWSEISVWGPLSQPKVSGLKEGAVLKLGDINTLRCSVAYSHEAEFLTWLVDGEIQGEDYHLAREGDYLVSQWQFVPHPGQEKVECRANGKESLADTVQFTIGVPEEQITTEKEEEAVFWIPHQGAKDAEEEALEEAVEEEFRRAENIIPASAHKMKKSDLDLRVEDRALASVKSSGVSPSSSIAFLSLLLFLVSQSRN